jgi:hypothetical protein
MPAVMNVLEAVMVYSAFGFILMVLFCGIGGRILGWSDPSAPTDLPPAPPKKRGGDGQAGASGESSGGARKRERRPRGESFGREHELSGAEETKGEEENVDGSTARLTSLALESSDAEWRDAKEKQRKEKKRRSESPTPTMLSAVTGEPNSARDVSRMAGRQGEAGGSSSVQRRSPSNLSFDDDDDEFDDDDDVRTNSPPAAVERK